MKQTYSNERQLRESLAILPEWGVTITQKSKFNAPAGTWVSEGLAAKQVGQLDPSIVMKGGDYQAVISNVPNVWIENTTRAFP